MALVTQLALEDVGALFLGPSFPTVDPMGPLLDQDEEEALSPSSSLEGRPPASPHSSISSLSPYQTLSCSPPTSPYPTHSSFLETKAGTDCLPFPWLGAGELLEVEADNGKDDPFSGMDWMVEKIDLSDFDLDSLIDSCSPEEPPSSPEELIACLDSHMDLGLDPFHSPVPAQLEDLRLALPLPDLPALPLELPQTVAGKSANEETLAVKTEPQSPSPLSPSYTLELGSEVDVPAVDKAVLAVTATMIPNPSGGLQTPTPIVLSLSPSGPFVVVLAAQAEPGPASPPSSPAPETGPASTDCDSDSGIESTSSTPPRVSSPSPPPTPSSPPAGSSRTKPYSKPDPASPASPKAPRVKSVSGAPRVVEKKLKKMEQNKTAATRYRQKKRVEQEVLNDECGELEKRNLELAEKAEALSREIKYLRDLMEEVRNAKSRRSKTSST